MAQRDYLGAPNASPPSKNFYFKKIENNENNVEKMLIKHNKVSLI